MKKNIKKYIKTILIIIFLQSSLIHGTFFLNRYWMPEISNVILEYRNNQNISLQPFVMTATEGNRTGNIERPYVYELDGILSIENLYNSYVLSSKKDDVNIIIPSEWIASGITVPMRLNGDIQATGLAWDLSYSLTPECILGWSSGFSQMTGAMNINPQEDQAKYKLNESFLFQINTIYKTLAESMNLKKNCSQFYTFCDQDLYLRFSLAKEYMFYMRKIKSTFRVGYVVPSSHTSDLYNPADVPAGTNGFPALYGGGSLDLLLKEDINISLIGKAFYLFPETKTIRVRKWTESNRYGSFLGEADITPGYIYQFASTLSVEGLRRGLGCEIGYSTWGQTKTSYGFPSEEISVISQVQMNIEEMSKWNQEHCSFILFYDFAREQNNASCNPFLSFAAQIPVQFFFAHSSARSLCLSFLFEVSY